MTQFLLSWDSYKSSFCTGFSSLQQNGEFVDMTIAADGHFVKVHQSVVALSSPYLKSIITSTPCQHPTIFLNKISYNILRLLLEYMYTGETYVSSDNLKDFTEAARSLHIKGLEILNNIDTKTGKDSNPVAENQGQIILPAITNKLSIKDDVKPKNDNIKPVEDLGSISINEDDNSYDCYYKMDETEVHDTDDDIPKNDSSVQQTTQDKTVSSKLQFSVTIRGELQIILNRYIYNLSWKRNKGIKRWRCVDYRCRHNCKAMVITKGNVVLNRSNPHNHPFHDKKILSKIKNRMIFSTMEDVTTKKEYLEAQNIKSKKVDDTSERDKGDDSMFDSTTE